MKIFISYNHNDRKYVDKLSSELIRHGYDVWFYGHLAPGEPFDETIHRKLDESEIVIVILTQQAVSSPAIAAEISRAQELNKRIIPFLLENIDNNPLRHLNYVDVRGGTLPQEHVYKSLGSKLAGDSTTDAPPPDVSKKKKKGE